MSINLGKDGIQSHLADILSPVYRELELATTYIGIYTVESTKELTVDHKHCLNHRHIQWPFGPSTSSP